MMIILMLISILIFVYMLFKEDYEELVSIPISGFIVKLGIVIYLLIELIGIRVIDEKIELYQMQNENIENKVANVVKEYMKHENETFKELKTNESYMTLVTLYPELKSDELIKEEIKLYEENNKKILNLKEQKINESIYRWWLYFG